MKKMKLKTGIFLIIVITITIIIPILVPFRLSSLWYPSLRVNVHERVTRVTIYGLLTEIAIYSLEKRLPTTEQELNDIILSLKLPVLKKIKALSFVNNIPSVYRNPNNPLKEGIYWFDGWERPLRYRYLGKNEKGEETFMIYSYGLNGIDENGKGDDIAEIDSIPIENKPNEPNHK